MIVSFNVCDFCGNQHEITKESNSGINVSWAIALTHKTANIKYEKHKSATFCDLSCYIEYLKKNTPQANRK
jgi:hypothetical protein